MLSISSRSVGIHLVHVLPAYKVKDDTDIKKIPAAMSCYNVALDFVTEIKYLGVTITADLRWNRHVAESVNRANRVRCGSHSIDNQKEHLHL